MSAPRLTPGTLPRGWRGWGVVVNKLAPARKRRGLKPFSEAHKLLASEWGTCAVGEAPRDVTRLRPLLLHPARFDAPHDGGLYRLGMDFMTAVKNQAHRKAAHVYGQIQGRIRELTAVQP